MLQIFFSQRALNSENLQPDKNITSILGKDWPAGFKKRWSVWSRRERGEVGDADGAGVEYGLRRIKLLVK